MKILYSAFTAFPSAGSEAQCGWAWANAMRNYNEVFIVTRNEAKSDIENYMNKNGIKNIHVFYHDIPSCLNIYGKTGKLYFPYYIMWQATVKNTVRKLHKKYHFDYIHHVTLGDFRVVGTAWKNNAKFIFGPVGGAQLTSDVFKPYIKGHEKSEKIRFVINKAVRLNPFYHHALNKADLVLAANKETLNYLKSIVKEKKKCQLLTENGIFAANISQPEFDRPLVKDTVNILWAGRLIYRKGIAFLLEALSLVKTERKFHLYLAGSGPELNHLTAMAKKLKIDDKVTFLGKIPYTKMEEVYRKSCFFVFPSIRETTGTVLFEAMSHGLPVLTFNQNGADLLIDESCGIKVNINQNLEKIKADFAESIKYLIENDTQRAKLGKTAYKKILNEYTWETKCESFEKKFLKGL